jgi:hypothetical protein
MQLGASAVGLSIDNIHSRLERMSAGVEFVLAAEYEQLFVVHKRRRSMSGPGPNSVKVVSVIYVFNGNVFQAPCLWDVAAARLSGALMELSQAQQYATDCMVFDASAKGWRTRAEAVEAVHPKEAIEFTQLAALNASFLSKIM